MFFLYKTRFLILRVGEVIIMIEPYRYLTLLK